MDRKANQPGTEGRTGPLPSRNSASSARARDKPQMAIWLLPFGASSRLDLTSIWSERVCNLVPRHTQRHGIMEIDALWLAFWLAVAILLWVAIGMGIAHVY